MTYNQMVWNELDIFDAQINERAKRDARKPDSKEFETSLIVKLDFKDQSRSSIIKPDEFDRIFNIFSGISLQPVN